MKKTIEDAEYIESELRSRVNTTTGLKITKANYWYIDIIQMLLNSYPILRKFYHENMGIKELQLLIVQLTEYLEMQYSESDELIFVDLTEMTTLISCKELMLWVLLALLKDKTHVNFKFNEDIFDDIKVIKSDAIDYLCDNSYFLKNSTKKEYHFTLSVAAILACDYYNKGSIIDSLVTLQRYYKKDLSLKEYIDYRKKGQNIDTRPILRKQSKRIKIKL